MTLKEKLKNNRVTFGSWLTIGHPVIPEIMATAGFEWITVDIEHTAISLETLQTLIMSIQASGMQALVRVSANEETVIKRVMDMGADGVIVPMIKSREEAQRAVSYVKYPPEGRRGVGLYRAQKYGTGFNEYKNWVKDEAVVIAQIEHIRAVEEIEAIITVPGLDGMIVGPYDLSGSMGTPGDYNRPEVKDALEKVRKACLEAGFPMGFHVIESRHEKIVERLDQGYTFLAFSLDFFFLGDRAREEMDSLRTVVGGKNEE